MSAVDCNPANTEHHWLCMLQTLPYRLNTLKKLNWCYRLWTLLALNAIELSRPYRLTLNTVYIQRVDSEYDMNILYLVTHKQYWHINSTKLTLHWTLHNTKQTALNATHNLTHTTKYLKSHHDIPHHTAISRHHFTPYAHLHHTILHHFTFCSPSRPQTFHITPYNKYISSVASFKSALNTHLFSSGLWLLWLCAWSWVPLLSCVCVFRPHSTS